MIVIPPHLAKLVDRIAKGELPEWWAPPPPVRQ